VIDVSTVITKSSNIGATKMALSLSEGALTQMFSRVGLSQHSASGFPGESVGSLPVRDRWRDIEIATLSYGYGLSVTAVQLAQAYAVLANKGIKKPLSVLHLNSQKEKSKPAMNSGETVLSPEIVAQVTAMMETVISSEGTAVKAAVPGYRVAGKTGTVHKIIGGSYSEDRYRSLFAGFAPVVDPRIVMVVIIDDPKGDEHFGGQVAAPVFSKVMEGILRQHNIEPDQVDSKWMMVSSGR
jgi:cell division protein FtsI (penicillin-binding protein 3)